MQLSIHVIEATRISTNRGVEEGREDGWDEENNTSNKNDTIRG